MKPSVSVVVPAYNEFDQLAGSLTSLHAYLRRHDPTFEWQIVVVDDGSTDGTDMIADEFAAAFHRVVVLHHSRNQGLGGALQTAFGVTTSDYVVVVDSDLSYAPEHIGALLDEIIVTGAEIVVASPYRAGGRVSGVPLGRLLASRSMNRLLALADGRDISTFTGMVRAYDGAFVRSLRLHSTDPTINAEILLCARRRGAHVVEIPASLDWTRLPVHRQGRASLRKLARAGLSTLALAYRLRRTRGGADEVPPMTATQGCPCCRSTSPPAPTFSKGVWEYGTCRECGLVHLDPMPKPDEIAALYGESYFSGGGAGEYVDYVADEDLHRANARTQLARLAQFHSGAGGSLLDVGCAYGFVADEARKNGWRVEGVEIATVAARHARDRFGLEVHADLDAAVETGRTFDVVAFFQVLAQFPSSADALASAHALLRPGGLVIIETANRGSRVGKLLGRRWHFISPPSAISLFEPEPLDQALGRCGFERIAIFPTRKAVSLALTANALEQRYGKVFAPFRALTRTSMLEGRAVRYPFADLMTVIARRRQS